MNDTTNTSDQPSEDHPLKVTSPRLEQEEFELTASGRRENNPSERGHSRERTATRARGPWDDPTPAVETEDTTLEGFGGDA